LPIIDRSRQRAAEQRASIAFNAAAIAPAPVTRHQQTALDSAAAVIIRAPTPIPIAATFITTKSP
jgi:hypothetical protein